MPYYRSLGSVPPQRHTQHRDPEGHLYYEELMGEEGFSSDSSLLYHRGVPSAIVDSQVWELPDQSRTPNHPLKPRHLKLHTLFPEPGDGDGACPVEGRRLVLANNDVRINYVVTGTAPSPYYRNAIGDECVYVESGSGVVETVFGVVPYRAQDYVLIPRATTHRWVPAPGTTGPSRLYVIEANSHIAPPKRYLSRFGQLLEHAPYCERDLHGPRETFVVSTGSTDEGGGSTDDGGGSTDGPRDVEVLVKHRIGGQVVGTRMTYDTHPFDVVGWDGCLYPYTFNLEDYMPITGKIHQPPPVHQVFEGWNFVICNFLPRKVDYHPLSIPVPYYHSNVDSDEIMFYVGGDYEARKGSGIDLGSISVHPGGYAHGPQPSAIEASLGAERFDETAVMIDTFAPLDLGEAGVACEDPAYAWTWAGRHTGQAATGQDGGPAVYSNS
jgi:homogentisate 1,2-dioxygenase